MTRPGEIEFDLGGPTRFDLDDERPVTPLEPPAPSPRRRNARATDAELIAKAEDPDLMRRVLAGDVEAFERYRKSAYAPASQRTAEE